MTNMPNIDHMYSEEAERAVLGSILINPYIIRKLSAGLKPEHFYLMRHQMIYEAMLDLHTAGQDVDYVTVLGGLKASGRLAEIGGAAYLTHLLNSTPTHIHASSYAQLVIQLHDRIGLAQLGGNITTMALDPKLTYEDIRAKINADVYAATGATAMKPIPTMKELAQEYWDDVERLRENPTALLGLPTGFKDYDDLILGLQPSDLILIGGRPGMGKSSLILSMVLNALTARPEAHVIYFSFEMPAKQIIQRAASIKGEVNLQTLRQPGRLTQAEYRRFVDQIGNIANLNLFVDDTSGLNPSQMRGKCHQVRDIYGRVDMIVVDYLQLANPDVETSNHVVDVGKISKALKDMAREFNVPVVAAAQLSRAVEQRADKRPVLSDLRESGSLEQDADIVTFLYMDEYYNEETEVPGQVELITAKHRNGPLGTTRLYFEKTLTKFLGTVTKSIDTRSAAS